LTYSELVVHPEVNEVHSRLLQFIHVSMEFFLSVERKSLAKFDVVFNDYNVTGAVFYGSHLELEELYKALSR